MQLIEGLLSLINIYGWLSVAAVGLVVFVYFRGNKVGNWIVSTLQASAIVQQHEQTISELRDEIAQLRQQLELYNQKLVQATDTIARLEERLDAAQAVASKHIHKRRGRPRKNDNNGES